ncbi:RNA polymerase sigma factor [Mycobacterium camsae]|uniref:RNA polymerase sigma factor n=1 Tax=Mycobacterium gordonae TaxID=1778 RepID=UPI001F11F9C8|nr:RNA polymerase sigma factor [Mycobacterium gordonae]
MDAIERVFREEYGRVIASLVRRFGDIDIAEEAAGEALLSALERWPHDGIPPNPAGWLTTTAANKAIDRLRRESRRWSKHLAAHMIHDDTGHEPTGPVPDERLRLIFTCCHPALAPEARVALTLRLLCGLTAAEIAAAFLVSETTMAQRISRAKKKIADAHIPYRVPATEDLGERVAAVLAVIYLVFNEGYLSTAGWAVRDDLSTEAIRLGRTLHALLPDLPEVTGLLALMLLTQSRRPSRIADGELVPLHEQDRSQWDRELIEEGHALVRKCLSINRPGRYQVLAAINAAHTDSATAADTDWSQIAELYRQLMTYDPGPVAQLNYAIAVAELDGPEVALARVDRLPPAGMQRYHAFHVTRAELLRRLGRSAEARTAYEAAIALVDNPAERAYLTRRRDEAY